MRHRFFAAAYRGSAVPQISIWLGLSLGLLPSGVAAANEAAAPVPAAPILSAAGASSDPSPAVDPSSAADVSASDATAEPAVAPEITPQITPEVADQSVSDQSTCVAGCNRNAQFVFHDPGEAIAPAVQPLTATPAAPPDRTATRAAARAATQTAASTRAAARAATRTTEPTEAIAEPAPTRGIRPIAPIVEAEPTAPIVEAEPTAPIVEAEPIAPTAPIAEPAPTATATPTSPTTRTAATRSAARAATATRATTRSTVRAATAQRDPLFGMQVISSPPAAIPVPVSDSEYQVPFPPAASPDSTSSDSSSDSSSDRASTPASATSPATPAVTETSSARRRPLTPPSLQIHGVYVYQGGESSARVRFTGVYPLTPNVQLGGSVDLTTGNGDLFSGENSDDVSINELYVTASLPGLPNLRFVVGQLDLTSYFDRNSFAKDGETQFFNPVFQTNPALTAVGIGSRTGALVNWSATDDLELRAAVFSSDRSISDFSLDGFAGEIGLRLADNFVVRGTYATGRDNGANTGFREIYSLQNGRGLRDDDREEAYGINAELFIPELSMGVFGRYGHYRNLAIDLGGDTFVFGVSFLDLFMQNDRLGIAYGRGLSNDGLRQDLGDSLSDVGEIFYDFEVVPSLRLGFTLQALNNFSDTIAGVRIRTVFNFSPRRSH